MPIDVNILRIIFIILGLLLVLGVYLWERAHQCKEIAPGETGWQESRQRLVDDSIIPGFAGRTSPASAYEELKDELPAWSGFIPDDQATSSKSALGIEANTQNLAPTTKDGEYDDYWHTANQDFVLQLTISAKKGEKFKGPDILQAAQMSELQADDAAVFRRYAERESGDDDKPILFSLANMVRPGVFPMQAMEEFQTTGLTLFAALPGPMDGVKLFTNMLSCARTIAATLNGKLQDETRSRLTNQTIKHIYSQIIEHHRQTQLAARRSQREQE